MIFDIEDKYSIKKYWTSLLERKVKEVEIRELKNTRSLQANKLYWEWLKIIALDTGDDANNLHGLFKDRFLGKKLIETSIGKSEVSISTTKLSVKEFYNYMLKVEVLANEFLNLKLPQPTDNFIKYINK